MRLLLVEDNEPLLALTRAALQKAGFETDGLATAAAAGQALASVEYGAMILDLGLPGEDGLEFLKRLRGEGCSLPIVVLTARGSVRERVDELDAGADDYLVKPFATEELVARIRVLLRRPNGLLGDRLEFGPLSLDTRSRQVLVSGRPQQVPPREVAVLEILLRRAGHVVAKQAVEDHLFGLARERGPNAVEVYVHRLRRFLESAATDLQIHTIRGVGYMIAGQPN